MKRLGIFIVDDHQIIRDGLRGLIDAEADMEVIGEADDGESAVRVVLMLRPDIVLMDISMPRMSGARATERIKHSWPDAKVIALTAHEDKGYIVQMLQAGASGFVLKVAAAEEIVKAIRVVMSGKTYLDPIAASKMGGNVGRQKAGEGGEAQDALTPREEEILRLVAEGYMNKEIASHLDISVKTVESHKHKFMEKLGFYSRVQVVNYALSQGWLRNQ